MAVSDLIKCVVEGAVLADTWSFGFYIQCASPVANADDMATLVQAWDVSMSGDESPSAYAQIQKMISADSTITRIAMYFYPDPKQPALLQAEKGKNLVGTGPASEMLQQALCVTINTGRSGSRHKGRIFLPAFGRQPTAHVADQGLLDFAALAAVDTMTSALAACRAHDPGDGSRVVVYSPTGDTVTNVTTVSLDNRFDVQRRRANKQNGARTTYTGPNP